LNFKGILSLNNVNLHRGEELDESRLRIDDSVILNPASENTFSFDVDIYSGKGYYQGKAHDISGKPFERFWSAVNSIDGNHSSQE